MNIINVVEFYVVIVIMNGVVGRNYSVNFYVVII